MLEQRLLVDMKDHDWVVYALMAGSLDRPKNKIGFGAASLDDFVVLKLVFVFNMLAS